MSRKRRIEGLRARRAAGIAPSYPDFEQAPSYDGSLGLPQPPIVEAPEPIEAPPMRGSYVSCGRCGSFIGSTMTGCQRCAGVL